ncbi:MAG: class I SAM-dependent methyltransferase [Promethearchaeota archaeon]|jgi:18S rRNA (guanine1575-N7)-methyltransferase
MGRINRLPRFPFDYINTKAEEYNNSRWMERNQKRATLLSIQYLYDKNLNSSKANRIQTGVSSLVMDLGCGTGFSSEILVDNGFYVVGVDILPDMLLKAREKRVNFNIRRFLSLILADINSLPIRESKIDDIISISAYNFIIHGKKNHFEKVKLLNDTAKCLNKILKKKGRIIIEFYPKDDQELAIFNNSFTKNGFEGFMVKRDPKQKSGQTFLLLKKEYKNGNL